MSKSPSIAEIDRAAVSLKGRIVPTPVVNLTHSKMAAHLPEGADVSIKMELFQNAGSFKYRGVLLGVDAMTAAERQSGVTAASAGNHAMAVSTAAAAEGIHARIAMPSYADKIRIEGCRKLGAVIDLFDNVNELFAGMERIALEDGRKILHPYEAPHMTLGAATCGAELARSVPDLDLVVIPVGGGGFISGMSAAIRQLCPKAQIIGVEPFGADTLYQSRAAGKAVGIDKIDTIADSLAAPMALPNSFAITQENIDGSVRVTDAQMISAMRLLYDALKIVPEPACAASLAAILGPLRDDVAGKKVAVVACGSNISLTRFATLIA